MLISSRLTQKYKLLCLLTVLSGCSIGTGGKAGDNFYRPNGWGLLRVPLLKPYELHSAGPKPDETEAKWDIELVSLGHTFNVKQVAVQDSIIFLRSGQMKQDDDFTIIGAGNVLRAWFVIDVRTKAEKAFTSEAEFAKYVAACNYPAPHWYVVDSLSNLLNNKKWPWQPQ